MIYHGTNVNLDVFADGVISSRPSQNYRPDAFTYLKDLNVNLMRLSPEVDSTPIINMNVVPNWASNFDALLTKCKNNGIKALPFTMGSYWGPEMSLGITQCPMDNPRQGSGYNLWRDNYLNKWLFVDSVSGREIISIPIADCKKMIDVLAGEITSPSYTLPSGAVVYGNTIGHNFITDPRIYCWETSNEQWMKNPAPNIPNAYTPLDWNIQMLDYIRSKGGKAMAAAPYSPDWGYWNATQYNSVFGSHSDMFQFHYYPEGAYDEIRRNNPAMTDVQKQEALRVVVRDVFNRYLGTPAVYPPEKVLLGEVGCWLGTGGAEGLVNVTFNNQDRINIYTAWLNAVKDVGLQNVTFYEMFAAKVVSSGFFWGVIAPLPSTGYTDNNLASLIRTAYATTPPTPDGNWITIISSLGIGALVAYLIWR